ncbi:MAG: GntR family transcriptional regulator [Rhodobacterales bacterium]
MDIRRADRIADELEEMVFSHQFSDGDRLNEIKLAKKFDVSRTPIREAIQRLVFSGLAEQIPRRGVFVRQPGPVELMEMFEVMAELEAVCARLAAMRISDQALVDLGDANRKCQLAVDQKDANAYYLVNERFHNIIYQQSGNRFLASETALLHKRLRPFRRQQLKLRGRMAQSLTEHEAIVAALEKGDPEASANALRDHIAIQGEKFHSLMRKSSDVI